MGAVLFAVKTAGTVMSAIGGTIAAEAVVMGFGRAACTTKFGKVCVDVAACTAGCVAGKWFGEQFDKQWDETAESIEELKKMWKDIHVDKENKVIQVEVSDEEKEKIEKVEETMKDLKIVKNDQEKVTDGGE